MQRRVLVLFVLALLLAAVPTAAQAKGASAATISGGGPGGLPGGPIDIKGDGEPGSDTDLANLADSAGVFAVLFEGGSTGALTAPPAGDRGPRYTITWTFPNGAGSADKVRQSVWPYAAGGPLTYMAPGQPVLDSTTRGGWYRAGDDLRQRLVALGLPPRPPAAASAGSGAVDSRDQSPAGSATLPDGGPQPAAGGEAAPGSGLVQAAPAAGLLVLVVAAALVLARRRRSRPGTAAR